MVFLDMFTFSKCAIKLNLLGFGLYAYRNKTFSIGCISISFLCLLLISSFNLFAAPVHAYFTLEKPVSELVQHIQKLEYDIFEEIGVPDTKVFTKNFCHCFTYNLASYYVRSRSKSYSFSTGGYLIHAPVRCA